MKLRTATRRTAILLVLAGQGRPLFSYQIADLTGRRLGGLLYADLMALERQGLIKVTQQQPPYGAHRRLLFEVV